MRLTLPLWYSDACELAGLPRPVEIDRLWAPRADDLVSLWDPYPDDGKDENDMWRALHRELNLRGEFWNSDLQYRDFLYRVRWDDGRPPLLLVGDARVVVHKGTCESLAASRRALEEAGHEVRALLVGTAETVWEDVAHAPAAFAASGAWWVERHRSKDDRAWWDATVFVELLREWAGHVPGG